MITLFFLFIIACGTALFAYAGYLYGGEDIARLLGVAGCIISYTGLCIIVRVIDYIYKNGKRG